MQLGGNLELKKVQEVERLALHAWPALESVDADGWLLRAAAGITRRANSVWPNTRHPSADLARQLDEVERFYHARGLPARYQICPAMQPNELDERLEQRGYAATAYTAVQTTSVEKLLSRLADPVPLQVQVNSQPLDAWWTCYAEADAVALESVAVRQAICAHIKVPLAFAHVLHEGKTIAVGSATVEERWLGLFNIATLPSFRRVGAARALIAALVRWGAAQGAVRAYLQVMANNDAALALYARLGFTTGYFYHYREEVYREEAGHKARA